MSELASFLVALSSLTVNCHAPALPRLAVGSSAWLHHCNACRSRYGIHGRHFLGDKLADRSVDNSVAPSVAVEAFVMAAMPWLARTRVRAAIGLFSSGRRVLCPRTSATDTRDAGGN